MKAFGLLVLGLCLVLILAGWGYTLIGFVLPDQYHFSIAFLAILTILMFRLSTRVTPHSKDFITLYLGSLVIKLLAALAYLVVLGLFFKETLVPNAVSFLLLYVIFTAMEVYGLLRLKA